MIQGQNELIGEFEARTIIKLAEEKYIHPKFPPKLEWYFVTHFGESAGQVLAAFELLEVTVSSLNQSLPSLDKKNTNKI